MSEQDSKVKQVLMDALGDATGWETESWESGVHAQMEALTAAGYAVVKLPKPQIDEFGDETWPVDSNDRDAKVKARRSDGRLMMDSVSHPFASRGHALSLAVALIAAARSAQQNRDE